MTATSLTNTLLIIIAVSVFILMVLLVTGTILGWYISDGDDSKDSNPNKHSDDLEKEVKRIYKETVAMKNHLTYIYDRIAGDLSKLQSKTGTIVTYVEKHDKILKEFGRSFEQIDDDFVDLEDVIRLKFDEVKRYTSTPIKEPSHPLDWGPNKITCDTDTHTIIEHTDNGSEVIDGDFINYIPGKSQTVINTDEKVYCDENGIHVKRSS